MTLALGVPAGEENPPRPFYSVSEAAALLGVSRVTVWRWIKSGRLSSARLGHRTVRIPREDMTRLMQPFHGGESVEALSPEHGHFVLFYEAEPFLIESVT